MEVTPEGKVLSNIISNIHTFCRVYAFVHRRACIQSQTNARVFVCVPDYVCHGACARVSLSVSWRSVGGWMRACVLAFACVRTCVCARERECVYICVRARMCTCVLLDVCIVFEVAVSFLFIWFLNKCAYIYIYMGWGVGG